MEKSKRFLGFDLARAYAIFGMYIVNFNIVFGNYYDTSFAGKFLSLFSGNSSTVFVILAGMGLALMTNRASYSVIEQNHLKSIVNKRAWFLFGLGLMLFLWWPADILHFYGSYMHIAALILFVDKKYYLYAAAIAVLIFHLLLIIIPYETGWNFNTLAYKDFWTVNGFLRNTFYNGWNAVFPWLAYFTVGMYLGRLNWNQAGIQKKLFLTGLMLYVIILLLQYYAHHAPLPDNIKFFITADYLPPFLPFVISTLGFGLMQISFFMYISKYLVANKLTSVLAKTGQMTLTHYISHLTLGMIILAFMSGKEYSAKINESAPLHPYLIFIFSSLYFFLSVAFSKWWLSKYQNGPFEMLMRKIAG